MRTAFYYDVETGKWGRNGEFGLAHDLVDLQDIPEKYRNILMLVMAADFLGNEDRTEDCGAFSEALSTPELQVIAWNNIMTVTFEEPPKGKRAKRDENLPEH